MYTNKVGRAASSEPAICTFQAIIWLPAMFCKATVTGQLLLPVSTTANRKSFQAEVNCQINTTTKAGAETGHTQTKQPSRKAGLLVYNLQIYLPGGWR